MEKTDRKTVLIFGDSNTWGYDWRDGSRIADRFTRLMQQEKPEWTVLEEGMNGRLFSCRDPWCDADGSRQIDAVIRKHPHLDWIVIALGANDARRMYSSTSEQWKQSMRVFLDALEEAIGRYCSDPKLKVLLVSPPIISKRASHSELCQIFFGESGQRILSEAGAILEDEAEKLGMHALRADRIGLTGNDEDGVHLEVPMHARLARAIVNAIDTADESSKAWSLKFDQSWAESDLMQRTGRSDRKKTGAVKE